MTRIRWALAVMLVAAGPLSAAAVPDFEAQLGAAGGLLSQARRFNAQRRRRPLGLGRLPKMVVIIEDRATDDWAKGAPSRYDGLPIFGPETPPWRARELWARLQETLDGLPKPPLAVAWDYYFPKDSPPESPATEELARLFSAAPFPLILGGWTESGALDPRIYRDGPNRYRGHISLWNDQENHFFSPVSPVDHRLRDVPDEDSIVVATVAGVLARVRRLDKEEGWRQARELARQVSVVMPAEEKGTDPETGVDFDVKGVKLIERAIPEVSVKSVIARDPDALKKIDGAIAVVAVADTDMGDASGSDLGDLFASGKQRPKCYVHAWTVMQLLGSRLEQP